VEGGLGTWAGGAVAKYCSNPLSTALEASSSRFFWFLAFPSLYNLPVRAAAIVNSHLSPRVVASFCDARVDVICGYALEPNDLPDVAMVFGGDGSVHRVLPSLAHTQVPLLVIPTGTANDFARCLGISKPSEALRAWHRYLDRGDNVRIIDLGIVRPMADPRPSESGHSGSKTFADSDGGVARPASPLGPVIMRHRLRYTEEGAKDERVIYFSGIAGLGLDAETNRLANRMPGWLRRHGGYVLAALRALVDYRPPVLCLHSYDLRGQETCLGGPVLLTAVGNAPEYGSGIRMLPQAQLDDGQLDLCFVPTLPKSFILFHFHRIYSGTHLLVPKVRYFRTRQVFIESDAPIPIYADGEYLCQTPAEISASPKALRVIVP
jgi:diacylglycerol kinase (ATP)